MVIRRVQFNPSTLKAAYDPVAKKVIMTSPYGVDCVECPAGKTPKVLYVTITMNTPCTECESANGDAYILTNHTDMSGTYELEQIESCKWKYEESLQTYINRSEYLGDNDCSEAPDFVRDYDTFEIEVEYRSDPPYVLIQVHFRNPALPMSRVRIIYEAYSPESGCLEITETGFNNVCAEGQKAYASGTYEVKE